jgi:hypothetical protein
MSGPKAWSGATTYAKAAIVLGSDDNIYKSLLGANLNHDPTTDDGNKLADHRSSRDVDVAEDYGCGLDHICNGHD